MIDFGNITEIYSESTKTGTASYIAPERYNKTPIIEQTEIYSIGVTIYESLTKKFPFGEIEPFQTPTFDTIIKEPININHNVPHWLNSVILRSLDIDTTRRYANYSEMLFELNNPNKVKPYFNRNISYIEKNPLISCRVILGLIVILNVIMLIV